MKHSRDYSIISHMIDYCGRIQEAMEFFGDSYDEFKGNNIYKDAVCLSILQIGELSGILTEDFKAKHDKMPWKQIKALRNIVAHQYGTIDAELLWDIVKDEIPELQEYCETILDGGNQNEKEINNQGAL